MAKEGKGTRLSKAAKEFNVGISTIIEFLNNKGIEVESNPNTKISSEVYDILFGEYSSDISIKKKSEELSQKLHQEKQENISSDDNIDEQEIEEEEDQLIIKDLSSSNVLSETQKEKPKVIGKIDIDPVKKQKTEKVEESQEQKIEDVEVKVEEEKEEVIKPDTSKSKDDVTVVGKIDLESMNQKTRPTKKTKEEKETERQAKFKTKKVEKSTSKEKLQTEEIRETIIETAEEVGKVIKAEAEKLTGPTVVGKIELPQKQEKKKEEEKKTHKQTEYNKKRKRKRIKKPVAVTNEKVKQEDDKKGKKQFTKGKKKHFRKEVDQEDVQKHIKETLEKLTSKSKSKGAKYRREKRDADKEKVIADAEKQEKEKNILKVTEFVSVSELSTMMNVPANEIIATCMNLGLFVSINQRLDAETMSLVADEFDFKVEFVSIEILENIKTEEDKPEDLVHRSPIVTIMGHVDHGKTKLLDHIRNTNVVAGEAGGITQHIGAYSVEVDGGKRITFLDTPGHEAFTAMRARGAQITDIVVVVIAADDGIMPQTVEAINHASAAGVPIIFAINKIDKPAANPEKIKEELSKMNYLVEDWGGKYQSQEISAKKGLNIDELLEKILLEAEMLELTANPNKQAIGTILESELDKGRGYISTLLVEAGTLKIGNFILAGNYTGHVKALYNERETKIKEAGPATPVQILGLNGAPQAGDKFNIMESHSEAKEIANRRIHLAREQGLRTQKHITLDEIGRRIAIGNFQELNIIIKGDVDGSIEALTDSLIKLSTEEIQINVIHKAVGQISESDVLLASASDAIIVGFQVRASIGARKLAEKEEIDIRLYSIIYDAVNELKDALEGMLSPGIKEEIVCSVEVREVFKITKVGSIAGCMVLDGKISRNTKVRVIRDGIIVYTGVLGSLKRFKDDVKEVGTGYECGLNIEKYNDIKVGDIIEGYEEKEFKRTLK